MAYRKGNEKSTKRPIKSKSPSPFNLLYLLGKPIYLTLFSAFVFLILLLNIIGHLANTIYYLILNYCKSYFGHTLPQKYKVAPRLFSIFRQNLYKNIFKNTRVNSKRVFKRLNNFKVWFLEILGKFDRYYKNSQPKFTNFLSQNKIKLTPKINFQFKLRLRFLISFFFVLAASSIFTFWALILKDLPTPHQLTSRRLEISTKIYDRNGVLLYNIYKDKNRSIVNLEDIPVHVKLSTLAIEDSEFYNHHGFSIKGMTRAIIKNAKEGKLTGGSTITQQLVKNALLSSEKTYIRKLKELVLAIQVERAFSKDEILEMYLNEVAYGGTAYGIQEASRTYFAKDVQNLDIAEAALLAGLPKSPTQYSPFGNNPNQAISRKNHVLELMHQNGYITDSQLSFAKEKGLEFANNRTNIKAPHFVMYVREGLENRYGKELVEQGGLSVSTTLDYNIQLLAEKVVSEELEKLKALNVTNASVVILNPKNGEILAMVGSKDYFDSANDGNVNVALSPRQPGSSIKVVNYAYALSHGFTPASIIEDVPTSFYVQGQPPYIPKNYEGGFKGKLTLRNALAQSRNIPAVKVLSTYGVNEMINMGRKMGITTWTDPTRYGLSLTLGGGEVKLIDLAQAYATIANYGLKPDLTSFTRISNYKGKIILEVSCEKEINPLKIAEIDEVKASESNISYSESFKKCGGEQVLDPRVAYMITDILKDNVARSPAFGANSLLNISGHPEVAVKTGTSNDLRDNLAIGYTRDYVVAVWVGNNDNSQMARIASGVTGATPIFNKIMSALLTDKESQNWEIPTGLTQTAICSVTGTLTCNGCPSTKNEWFLEENTPNASCNANWFAKNEDKLIPPPRIIHAAVNGRRSN